MTLCYLHLYYVNYESICRKKNVYKDQSKFNSEQLLEIFLRCIYFALLITLIIRVIPRWATLISTLSYFCHFPDVWMLVSISVIFKKLFLEVIVWFMNKKFIGSSKGNIPWIVPFTKTHEGKQLERCAIANFPTASSFFHL